MKILVTGANGFIGKNLCVELRNRGYQSVLEYDLKTPDHLLDKYTTECTFVVHLAGINRPQSEDEFMKGNFGFTQTLLNRLKENNNKSPILITSSIQAELDNAYGKSKKEAEDFIDNYGEKNGVTTYIYRLSNAFGKWCRPNYNSVVATFCYNIANDIPIQINEPNRLMKLVYIDDIVNEIIFAIEGKANIIGKFCEVPIVNRLSLGRIAELLYSFKDSRSNLFIPEMGNDIIKKLYSTYLSYLPKNQFSYLLKMNVDSRGSFTEFLRSSDRGQVSVNIAKPGIRKGQHWHHTKNEKFLVVKGKALIQFRKIYSVTEIDFDTPIIEYHVSGDVFEVVDIPPGYTHCITNVGDEDLITVMWANEVFNKENPDTYFLPV